MLAHIITYSKTCVKRPLSKRPKIGFQDLLSLNAGQKYCRMLQGEHSAILLNFIKLPFVIKIFVLSIFEWPFYTCFTVLVYFLFQSCIVAVVVPDPETIPKFAADKLGLKGEMSELCQSAVRHTPTIAWFIVIIVCPSFVSPSDACQQFPLNYISS